MKCLTCDHDAPRDRAYSHWCRETPDHAVSGYRPKRDTTPDLPPAVIEARFRAAKRECRRSLTTVDAWAQRLAPVPGSRLEDYAPKPGELPTHREARGVSVEARRADQAKWQANRKATRRAWVGGGL